MAAIPVSVVFPSANDFFANKPADMGRWQWLFHPANPYRFDSWVARLLSQIKKMSARFGFTFFRQSWLAKFFKVSDRWVREILKRLELLGVIVTRRVGRNVQYQLAADLLADPVRQASGEASGKASAIAKNKSDATIAKQKACKTHGDGEIREKNVDHGSTRSSSGQDDKKPADPIVELFETTTKTHFKRERDATALAELHKLPILAVSAAIMLAQCRAAEPIRSLAYCLPVAKEVLQATTNQQTRLSDQALAGYVEYLRRKLENASRL